MITIDQLSSTPIYQQIISQYKTLIICDILKSGDKLESLRSLSLRIGINPNTIQKAYSQMESADICQSVHGKGRFVADNAKEIIRKDISLHKKRLREVVSDLTILGEELTNIIKTVEESYNNAQKNISIINKKDEE